ncbi:putative receptor-like protein kinase family [Cinnamomum micranthum f. kanehirae]|uniref:non-specific serine/threonine protein kinase n=1 Tax=Cinnamomum micranthum f. kanehirae TaxID=337451 RepID=A0A443N151_9MAGN|nr:putative receptor-like protein kinase family [Cinnamomum micranthum f. kanehirae]
MTIFIRTTSISQGNSSEQNPICAPSKFNCGRISSITYPFSIEGRPENCSYPGFNLTCNNNSPEMEIGSKTYFVKAIDYDSQMLTIVDTDVIGMECFLRGSSSTLDFSRFAYSPNDVEVDQSPRTYHVNIVTLLGHCYERSKRALISEFMSNGSLEKLIYSNKSGETQRNLDCEKLFQIAVGIVRGIEYLHSGCSMRILHFDIKPHNILLDDELCPKISNFGLAKLCPKQESIFSMQDARWTVGYIMDGPTYYAPVLLKENLGSTTALSFWHAMLSFLSFPRTFYQFCPSPPPPLSSITPSSYKELRKVQKNPYTPPSSNLSNMHSHLLFTSLFLIVFLTISLSQGDSDEGNQICAPSKFDCGSFRNITYPFWVKDRPLNCSYPGFNLTCNDNSPEIKIGSKTYQVKAIDYGNQVVTLVDTDVIGKECPPLASSWSLDFSLFAYTPNDYNLTIYNCPHGGQDPFLHVLPCLSNGSNYSYYKVDRSPSPIMLDPYVYGICAVSVFTILNSWVANLGENLTNFGGAVEDGFNVSWVVDSGKCWGCVTSGGNCGHNPNQPDQPVCYCSGKAYQGTCPLPSTSSKDSKKVIKVVIGALSAVASILLVCIVIFLSKFVKRTYVSDNKVEAFLKGYGSLASKRFRYSKLKKMTNSFKDKFGEGGYGGVFKGKLKDGRFVAVKVLNNSKGNGEEFINEVASIGRTSHVNIVTLLGFCYEGSKRALVYDFMSNGSLEKFIYSNKSKGTKRILDWEKLFEIAVGIARGLEYLHRGCSTRILHFDIKPHNILLDDVFCPKISDFGLAKLCPKQESIISMQDARGTIGYTAPEVYCRNFGRVSHKSDVYSYGMMVLEMVGGRKNIDAGVENTSEIYFPHWIYNHIALENSSEVMGIVEEEKKEIVRKMVLVGLWCIQTDPTHRPSMSKVVEMLEGSVKSLEMPPKPFLSSHQ